MYNLFSASIKTVFIATVSAVCKLYILQILVVKTVFIEAENK
jgi:hypothetical protein